MIQFSFKIILTKTIKLLFKNYCYYLSQLTCILTSSILHYLFQFYYLFVFVKFFSLVCFTRMSGLMWF